MLPAAMDEQIILGFGSKAKCFVSVAPETRSVCDERRRFSDNCLRQLLTRRGQEEAGIFVPCHDGVYQMKKVIFLVAALTTGLALGNGCLGFGGLGSGNPLAFLLAILTGLELSNKITTT
jgi:hypothetical protein